MNIYGNYKKARNAAWQVLIDYNISTLPIKIKNIADKSGISIIKNTKVNELTGDEIAISYLIGDKWYIVYDDTALHGRARFSVAHELGHIFMGHPIKPDENHYARKNFDIKSKPIIETEADIFASRLLAPSCVLWGLGIKTADEICNTCDITLQAAQIRSERMELLYKRNKFLTHPMERKVYENFNKFILDNKK